MPFKSHIDCSLCIGTRIVVNVGCVSHDDWPVGFWRHWRLSTRPLGRVLMRRAEVARARMGGVTPHALGERDFLLGVSDTSRQGALRFSEAAEGPFLNASETHSIPPLLKLPRLLSATERLLDDEESADINPTPAEVRARILTTTIDLDDGTASLDLTLSVAKDFRISKVQSRTIIREVAAAVSRWRDIAERFHLDKREIEGMASAFEHEDLRKAAQF